MIRRNFHAALLIGIAALALAACGGSPVAPPAPTSSPASLTPLTLYMGYRPDIQFAPFYVGIEKGFFAEQGLDVRTEHASESDIVRLVGTNTTPFGIVSGEQVLLARAQGVPVVYVFEWFDRFPVAIAAKQSAGIREPADLAGRSVGTPMMEGASYIGLEALLASAGLTDRDIDLQVTGFTQVETLVMDRVESVVIYVSNEPVQLEAQGVPVDIIRVADYADLVSNGLITNERTLAENPDLVRAVNTAFAQAILYAIDHPDETFEISKRYVEGLDDPAIESTQRGVLAASIELWRADRPGESERASWENMQHVLLMMSLLSEPLDLDAAFSNAYLP